MRREPSLRLPRRSSDYTAGYCGKPTREDLTIRCELLHAQVDTLSRRYVRLRAAVLDHLHALPSDASAAMTHLRHELSRVRETA